MTAPKEGPGHYVAASIRLDAYDLATGQRGPWLGHSRECPECGRRVLSLEFDGYCSASTCGGEDEYVREMNRRAGEKARADQAARGRLAFLERGSK